MKTKVSIFTLTISCLLVFIATYAIPRIGKNKETTSPVQIIDNCPSNMEQIRIKNYNYVQPLILANLNTQSPALEGLRNKIEQYIWEVKKSQQVDEVTVYFRKLNGGSWFCINPNETYNPASMSKIIYLITYLKEAESNPSVLNKKIYFARHFSEGNHANIVDFALKENSYYTVKELLLYMIKNSDNDATLLLSQNMNQNIYKDLFTDLNLPNPPAFGEYYITAVDYSKFFRVLFNATYVRPEYSEYGLKLLTQSTYTDGIRNGVDDKIEIAHKFGERIIDNKAQLHEFGIVFVAGDPYLLGIMTKGTSLKQLSGILQEISRITFSDYMSKYHS